MFIFLNTFKYVSAHETITLINASIIHPPKLESEFYVANINVSGEPYQIFVDLIET